MTRPNGSSFFVAVDQDGASVPVRQWSPTTQQGEHLERIASDRAGIPRVVEEIMNGLSYSDDGGAEQCTLRLFAEPGDVNWGGNVHGGNITRWIDEAGQVCTQEWVEGRTFASCNGGIRFCRPIPIGEVVEINARLVHAGVLLSGVVPCCSRGSVGFGVVLWISKCSKGFDES